MSAARQCFPSRPLKIVDAFTVDYLVAEGINASFDNKNLKRLHDIEKLDSDTKEKSIL